MSRSPSRRRRSSASSRALALIKVSVQPPKISLQLTDEGVVKTEIKIVNNGSEQILWKLQTTEPKKYSVSPTKGIVNGGQTSGAEIQLLKVYCEQALADARSGASEVQRSTKFRLQCVRVSENPLEVPEYPADLDTATFDARWSTVLSTLGKSAVFYEKLQCVFEYPSDIVLPDGSPRAISPTRTKATVQAVQISDVKPLVRSTNETQAQKGCCVIS